MHLSHFSADGPESSTAKTVKLFEVVAELDVKEKHIFSGLLFPPFAGMKKPKDCTTWSKTLGHQLTGFYKIQLCQCVASFSRLSTHPGRGNEPLLGWGVPIAPSANTAPKRQSPNGCQLMEFGAQHAVDGRNPFRTTQAEGDASNLLAEQSLVHLATWSTCSASKWTE